MTSCAGQRMLEADDSSELKHYRREYLEESSFGAE